MSSGPVFQQCRRCNTPITLGTGYWTNVYWYDANGSPLCNFEQWHEPAPTRFVQRCEWIAVKDRLPDGDGLLLLCIDRPNEVPLRDIGWYDDGFRWRLEKRYPGVVTDWMPLPERPAK